MRKLATETEKELKDILNKFPSYQDTQIANKLNISRMTVAKYRNQIAGKYDSEFVKIVAGKFIAAYGQASNYWNLQITELEELKNSKKTIYKTGNEGQKYPEEVDLEPMDILAICKQQAELQKMILVLAGQGEVREVIRIMRSGKIPMLQPQEVL